MKDKILVFGIYALLFLACMILAYYTYDKCLDAFDDISKGKRVRLTIVGIPIEKEEKDDGLSESPMDTE